MKLAPRTTEFTVVDVEYAPENAEMKRDIIYVSERFGLAIHLCAGGCPSHVVMPFRGPESWTLTRDGDLVTFAPSILQGSCHHHYFIEQNKVKWCP